MSEKLVRIGGASGAWGDSPRAFGQLVGAGVDYLMMDYLAEVTMSLLARARLKDPQAGYPPDSIAYLKEVLPEIARRGVKIATNAGGVNPSGCKRALEAVMGELGLSLKVAMVEGDDVMALIDKLRAADLREVVSGEKLPARLLTANAYLGAIPIKTAFDDGADIVITGRCADSALALGILMHEFGWRVDDYDRLGAGSLVGHILECGPQATGGTFSDWDKVPGWENIGYPIAECHSDGSFVVSKPHGTGGLIVPAVIAEQALYEIGDPAAYFLPDVTADFSNIRLTPVGPNRVKVENAGGRPPTHQYKVSATYQDGYRAVATVSIVGPSAALKAERTAEAMIARSRMTFAERGFPDFTATHIEALGAEASYGPKSAGRASREVLLRLVVEHQNREALEIFAREIGSIGLSCAPGTTGIYSGRPKPTPVVRLFSFFVDKAVVGRPKLQVGERPAIEVEVPFDGGYAPPDPCRIALTDTVPSETTINMPLARLAYARSGDKGNDSNIAIIARKPQYMPLLRKQLTPERIVEHLGHLVVGPAERFEAPGLNALNFLIRDALGGGGMASRRIDPQGKAYGQMALEMIIPVPKSWAEEIEYEKL
jgi:Acyclic terpene utilisation family protein AtuA